MKSKSLIVAAGASALLAFVHVASAHPGHGGTSGFAAGVRHPLSGPDHILAMIAVGLCAAQMGKRALWMLPVTFLAFMIGGGLLALHGTHVPMIEQNRRLGIAARFDRGRWLAAGGPVNRRPDRALCDVPRLRPRRARCSRALVPRNLPGSSSRQPPRCHVIGIGIGTALKRRSLSLASRAAGGDRRMRRVAFRDVSIIKLLLLRRKLPSGSANRRSNPQIVDGSARPAGLRA